MKTTTFCNIWRLFIKRTDHFYLKKKLHCTYLYKKNPSSNISFCRQKKLFLEIMQTPKSLHITYAGATAGILVCL